MRPGLLDWLDRPRADRALRFAEDGGGWRVESFARLAAAVGAAAAELRAAGLGRGGVACVVLPEAPDFVAAFFGVLAAGGTPSPLLPPRPFEGLDGYAARLAEVLGVARPEVVVTEPGLEPLVERALEAAGVRRTAAVLSLSGEPGSAGGARPAPAELALVQFTSGSSGRPRGVRVSRDSLEANLDMIRRWLDLREGDATASWLPLYHDMGLIGCLLTPLVLQQDVWLLRPEHFIADPLRWLRCFGEGGAAATAAPNFGYALAARRVAPEALAGMDFSAWRVAIVGAERVDPGALEAFARLAGPHGFSRAAFRPAYGLAEATLAVTGHGAGTTPRAVRPDWETLRFGAPVGVRDEAILGDPSLGDGAGWLVGCGAPLDGVAVSIHDERGAAVPEGCLGEIVVGGPTVARGHLGGGEESTTFVADRLQTGDAGFVRGGELFVVGRMGDSLKVRARRVYVEDLEAKLGAIQGLGGGRCVVLPGLGATESVVVLVESAPGEWVTPAVRLLRREVGDGVVLQILGGSRGLIHRTSSGKPRRRVMWQALMRGELRAAVIADDPAPEGAP